MNAPDFDLPGVDGRSHTLGEYAGADVLVLIQSCNHCPYVRAWEGRMKAIASDYAGRGVKVVAFNSNDPVTHPGDSFDEMVARAESESFPFDYLHDADQSLARTLGSERTPEAFVFDKGRQLVYHGAIDDDRDGDNITRNYLRDALDAALAGSAPAIVDTAPVGCTVKWKG